MISGALPLGLLLGLRHASDADHVCTVATLLRCERGLGHALRTALVWGLGHAASFLAVGLGVIWVEFALPAPMQQAADAAIGALLVWLGVSQWRHARCTPAEALRPRSWRTLATGALHGLAGSGGVALLALTTVGDARAAVAWLLLFAIGTTAGMVAVTLLLAIPLRAAARHGERWRVGVLRAAGALGVAAGLFLSLEALR